jgi:hypothetical protein
VRRIALFLAAVIASARSSASPPPNDNCAAVQAIPVPPYTNSQITAEATTEPADPTPQCGNGSTAMSVWYRFTAGASAGTLSLDTFGSDYDTIVSAWRGVCGQLTAWPDGCDDDYGASQSQVTVAMSGGETVYLLVSAYFGDGGNLVLHAAFTAGAGDLAGLSVAKAAGGNLALSWEPSCLESDTDFEIYEGAMGSWTSYAPATCTTGGGTSAIVTPPTASAYYLIVPKNGSREGSYGQYGMGLERPQSMTACSVQSVAGCPPACAHVKCAIGAELTPACDPCAAQVCAVDPYCCTFAWDGTCVADVRSVCGSLLCPDSRGTCAHGLCQTGLGLTAQCDDPPVDPSCVSAICNADSFCCINVWDASCVAEVTTVCGESCN